MRLILTILGVLAALAVGAFGLFHLLIGRPMAQEMAPARPKNARVELLADRPDAVILMPFVTGDEPRLVRGETLRRLAPRLWFTSTSDAGNIIGAAMFGMMGVPPVREIATSFREGAPLAQHSCLTVRCRLWPTTQGNEWGMSGLKGLGDTIGPVVELRHETFNDHADYLKAHASVRTNPRQWFASVAALTPQPPPDGMRDVTITLPSRLIRGPVDGVQPREDAAVKNEIEALARSLLAGTTGRLHSLTGITPVPLWARKDDEYLRTSDGGLRAIPDLGLLSPQVTLRVPEARADRVRAAARQAARTNGWRPPDAAAIEDAIARAFRVWGIDAACLPACGSASPSQPMQMTSDVRVSAPPFWTLEYWVVPVARAPEGTRAQASDDP